MTSAPSRSAPRPRWWRSINWPITEPFGVRWATKAHCADAPLRHLRNALNDDLPITRCRDGQEVADRAAREMVRVLDARARADADRERERARGGGGGGGGSGGGSGSGSGAR
ncbi:hypothetical protein F4809DRAFT_308882 [Biscogniauxia mediterranea]|nr:hypothetical protein F4809DRAFT_308882 [Biscogniauxia mediterranea]